MRIDWLLANTDIFREVTRYMRGPRSAGGNLSFLLLAAACLVLFWWGLQYLEKCRQDRGSSNKTPKDLFHDLCRVHQLSRAQRQLLVAAVARSRPEEMPRVFVDPSILGSLAVSNALEAESYSRLLTKLFGERRES
jgi:hypothetical protein